jgi:hypothetical protein
VNRDIVRATRGHIVARRQVEIIVRRPADGTHDEVLLIPVNDRVARKAPRRRRSRHIEREGFVRGSGTCIDIQIQFCAVGIVERDRAANGKVTRGGFRSKDWSTSCRYSEQWVKE